MVSYFLPESSDQSSLCFPKDWYPKYKTDTSVYENCLASLPLDVKGRNTKQSKTNPRHINFVIYGEKLFFSVLKKEENEMKIFALSNFWKNIKILLSILAYAEYKHMLLHLPSNKSFL